MDSTVSRRRLFGVATAVVLAVATAGSPAFAAPPARPATMIPISVVGLRVTPDGLVADVKIGNHVVQNVPVDLTAQPNPADPTCPILNLTLAPIHLDLLGLVVDTSPICLSITAIPGGGLLGDLLCGVANLLNGGLDLGAILGGLTGADLGTLLSGLTDLLNGALGNITNPAVATPSVGATQAGACDILNLSLGPVDLTLLGLNVHLDDCDDGPVTVDITAEPGAGNLLGNLLCNLAGLLDGPANGNAIANALNRVADAILQLVNAL